MEFCLLKLIFFVVFPWIFLSVVCVTDTNSNALKNTKEAILSEWQSTWHYRRGVISSCLCLVDFFRWSQIYLTDDIFILLYFWKMISSFVLTNLISRLQKHKVQNVFTERIFYKLKSYWWKQNLKDLIYISTDLYSDSKKICNMYQIVMSWQHDWSVLGTCNIFFKILLDCNKTISKQDEFKTQSLVNPLLSGFIYSTSLLWQTTSTQ